MAIQFDDVRRALQAEEPDYGELAQKFGVEALPHLKQMIGGEPSLLASKAAYLAGVIGTDAAMPVLRTAASSSDVEVRLAAAAAAKNLGGEQASDVLLALVDDNDLGVQKVALRSVPESATEPLVERITALNESMALGGEEAVAFGVEPAEAAGMTEARRVVAEAAAEALARVKKQ